MGEHPHLIDEVLVPLLGVLGRYMLGDDLVNHSDHFGPQPERSDKLKNKAGA